MRDTLGVNLAEDNASVVRASDIIILAVKPNMVQAVLKEATVSLHAFESHSSAGNLKVYMATSTYDKLQIRKCIHFVERATNKHTHTCGRGYLLYVYVDRNFLI